MNCIGEASPMLSWSICLCHTRCRQKKISQVSQVIEISEIWIFQISKLFWPLKMTSTRIKVLKDNNNDGDNNKGNLNVTDKFFPLLHVIIRLDGSYW